MNLKKHIFWILFFVSIVYSSCGEYEVLELERQCKKVADSLFRAHRDSLTKFSDTLCDNNYQTYFKVSKDSIHTIQLKKINELIEK